MEPPRIPTDAERAAFDQASQQSIIAGGLPLNAVRRLQEQESRVGTPSEFWTSDLSVNELLLTHECGFEPLGQVMGSSVYNVGFQYLPTSAWVYSSGEFGVLTRAHYEARRLAFDRLRQEASLLKADGVVGVQFRRQGEGLFDAAMLEYIAIGTAVRLRNAPPRGVNYQPFVSNLSGQDHWLLRKGGYKPVGFVYGNCSWAQYPDWRSQNAMMSWSNAELTSLTQGMYTARSLAMERMDAESRALGAVGVVGADVEMHVQAVEGQNSNNWFIMTFTSFGTAIALDNVRSDVTNLQPQVSLRDSQQ